MILTDGDVLNEIEAKNIVIEPFRREVRLRTYFLPIFKSVWAVIHMMCTSVIH